MPKKLLKRILLVLLPVLFTVLIPQLLIDRPTLSRAWTILGPVVISATEDAVQGIDDTSDVASDPDPQPAVKKIPLVVRWPGGGVVVPPRVDPAQPVPAPGPN